MNILITSIGIASAADIVIKTLRANNHRVIGCDVSRKEWIAESYNVDEFIQSPAVTEAEAYKDFIKLVCEQYKVQYIMPLFDSDIDIFCTIRNELLECGICICMSEPAVTKLCRDKYLLARYIEQENICPVIPTCLFAEADESTCRYPLMGKRRFGGGSEGLIMINNQSEFRFAKEFIIDREYILQPYIEGNVFNVDVIRDINGNVVCIARQDLLQKAGNPISVEIVEKSILNKICVKIANSLGTIGAVNIEFIETPDQIYLMEVNPRPSGGAEYSHIAGYNVVLNHLRCFTGESIDQQISPQKMIIARKYEEYVTQVLWDGKDNRE